MSEALTSDLRNLVNSQESNVNNTVKGAISGPNGPSLDKSLLMQQQMTMLMTVVQTVSAQIGLYKNLYSFILQKI